MIQIQTNTYKKTNSNQPQASIEKKKKDKNERRLSNKTINIIRTTQRNNIDLTGIADNKANVLLSLNTIILAGVVPLVLANTEMILVSYLWIPLVFLAVTCFSTLYMSAQVLKPSDFDDKRNGMKPGIKPSPFFFGNFYKMESSQYYDYLKEGLADEELIKAHLAQDLYYIGRRLGQKMDWTRKAFNIFIVGMFLTLVSTAVALTAF